MFVPLPRKSPHSNLCCKQLRFLFASCVVMLSLVMGLGMLVICAWFRLPQHPGCHFGRTCVLKNSTLQKASLDKHFSFLCSAPTHPMVIAPLHSFWYSLQTFLLKQWLDFYHHPFFCRKDNTCKYFLTSFCPGTYKCLVLFCVLSQSLSSPGCPQIGYGAEDDFELQILLPLPPKHQDYRCALPGPATDAFLLKYTN